MRRLVPAWMVASRCSVHSPLLALHASSSVGVRQAYEGPRAVPSTELISATLLPCCCCLLPWARQTPVFPFTAAVPPQLSPSLAPRSLPFPGPTPPPHTHLTPTSPPVHLPHRPHPARPVVWPVPAHGQDPWNPCREMHTHCIKRAFSLAYICRLGAGPRPRKCVLPCCSAALLAFPGCPAALPARPTRLVPVSGLGLHLRHPLCSFFAVCHW